MDAEQRTRGAPRAAHKLGTFGGVFTPSVLTILGIILFLRLGFVVGSAGLPRALGILGIAVAISVLTSLSVSAIATNRKVKGGGDYYLVSRSLGIEYGGALGLLLFGAQAISVAFYCSGFGEGVAALFPDAGPGFARAAAFGAALAVVAVAYVGADFATRFQYAIMLALIAALVSFFAGSANAWSPERIAESATLAPSASFWWLFALFFPAVTGFTQGISMSGDLRDPARSIPLGTFLAVGLSTLVYGAAMVAIAAAVPTETLRSDTAAMRGVAAVPGLIDAGVIAATLSSALASCLGGPRILQALAVDGVFRPLAPFAHGVGPARNPRRAVLASGAIALATLALGGLDTIAALVSMFFLLSYGLLNYATYVEATAASPSFRPRFRFFHARASLAGMVLCGAAMLAIDPVAAVLAGALLGAVYQYLRRTAVPARWRDSRRAYRFRLIKDHLRELAAAENGPRDWQPHVLAFTEDVERRGLLLSFATWITGSSGLVTAVRLLEGEGTLESSRRACEEAEESLRAELEEAGAEGFPLAVAAPNTRAAAATVVQAWGIGPIRANTVLLNWLQLAHTEADLPRALRYGRVLRAALRLQQNVVVLDADRGEWKRIEDTPEGERRIDVWWFEDDSSRLALLFAHLMRRTDAWDEAKLRVLAPAAPGTDRKLAANLEHRLAELRIEARIDVVVDADADAVAAHSADATLVLLPMRLAGMRILDPFGGPADALLERLPIAALVAAASDVRLGEDESEEEIEGAADDAAEEEAESTEGEGDEDTTTPIA